MVHLCTRRCGTIHIQCGSVVRSSSTDSTNGSCIRYGRLLLVYCARADGVFSIFVVAAAFLFAVMIAPCWWAAILLFVIFVLFSSLLCYGGGCCRRSLFRPHHPFLLSSPHSTAASVAATAARSPQADTLASPRRSSNHHWRRRRRQCLSFFHVFSLPLLLIHNECGTPIPSSAGVGGGGIGIFATAQQPRHVAVCGRFTEAAQAETACANIQGSLSRRYDVDGRALGMGEALRTCTGVDSAWVGSTLYELSFGGIDVGLFDSGPQYLLLTTSLGDPSLIGTNLVVMKGEWTDGSFYSAARPSGPPRGAMCWSAYTPCPEGYSCHAPGTASVGYITPNCCNCIATARGPNCQCAVGNGPSDCSAVGATHNQYDALTGTCDCQCKPSYHGPHCRTFCAKDNVAGGLCRSASTATVGYDSGSGQCVCTCSAGSKGPLCQCARQSAGGDCYDRGTSAIFWTAGVGCECQCSGPNHVGAFCQCTTRTFGGICHDAGTRAPVVDAAKCGCSCHESHVGAVCEYRTCTPADDCVAPNTANATGFGANAIISFGGNCTCNCLEQFVGSQCETEICHVNHHCRGQGIAISGTFPDCLCTCNHYYGGRDCRTLTATLSLTRSDKASASLTVLGTPTLSSSVTATTSRTGSMSHTATRSHPTASSSLSPPTSTPSATKSGTVSASHSASLTATLSPSYTASPPSASRSATGSASALSPSVSVTCREYGELDVNNTCEVLRPLPAHAVALLRGYMEAARRRREEEEEGRAAPTSADASVNNVSPPPPPPLLVLPTLRVSAQWLLGADPQGQCTSVRVPYSMWGGKPGERHWIAVSSVDSRIMLRGPPLPVPTVMAATATSSSSSSSSPNAAAVQRVTVLQSTMQVVPVVVGFPFWSFAANATRRDGSVLPVVGTLEDAARFPNATDLFNGDGGSASGGDVSSPGSGEQDKYQYEYQGDGRGREDAEGFVAVSTAVGQFHTALVEFEYSGPPTLNKVVYSIRGCGEWSRCPVVMPGRFVVVLASSDRLLDPIVAEASAAVGAVVSVVSALTVVPSVVLQLGVVSSLREMSRCRAMALDDEDDGDDGDGDDRADGGTPTTTTTNGMALPAGAFDDGHGDATYEDYTSGVLNPLGLTLTLIGGGGRGRSGRGGGRPYLRGAIATSAFYAAVLSALMLCYSWGSHAVAGWLGMDSNEDEGGEDNTSVDNGGTTHRNSEEDHQRSGGGGGRKRSGARNAAAVAPADAYRSSGPPSAPPPPPPSEPSPRRHPLHGYPSVLSAVAAFAMDGAIGAGTMLAVYAFDGGDKGGTSAAAADVVVGSVAVAVCFVYIGHVLYVTTGDRFPSSALSLRRLFVVADGDGPPSPSLAAPQPQGADAEGKHTKRRRRGDDALSPPSPQSPSSAHVLHVPSSYQLPLLCDDDGDDPLLLLPNAGDGFVSGGNTNPQQHRQPRAVDPPPLTAVDSDLLLLAPTAATDPANTIGDEFRFGADDDDDDPLGLGLIDDAPLLSSSLFDHTASTSAAALTPTVAAKRGGGDGGAGGLLVKGRALREWLSEDTAAWEVVTPTTTATAATPPLSPSSSPSSSSSSTLLPASSLLSGTIRTTRDKAATPMLIIGGSSASTANRVVGEAEGGGGEGEGRDNDGGDYIGPSASAASASATSASTASSTAASLWLQRYEAFIEDSALPWYCGLEMLVVAFVCVLGSLAYENTAFCVGRGVACALLCFALFTVMAVGRPPFNRWRWLFMSAVLLLQSVAAALAAANAVAQDAVVELGMDSLGVAVSLLLLVVSVVDMAALALSLREPLRLVVRKIRSLLRRWRRRGLGDVAVVDAADCDGDAGVDVEMAGVEGVLHFDERSTPFLPPSPSASPLPPIEEEEGVLTGGSADDADGEGAIIRQILADFRAYDEVMRPCI